MFPVAFPAHCGPLNQQQREAAQTEGFILPAACSIKSVQVVHTLSFNGCHGDERRHYKMHKLLNMLPELRGRAKNKLSANSP